MLADHNQRAVEVGREALRMAEELGLDELRTAALINIGSARGGMGDPGGLSDLEHAVHLAAEANAIRELIRAHNNLGSICVMHGELGRARAEFMETRRLAVHYGHRGFVRFIDGGPGISMYYATGQWDTALEHADAFAAEVESGSPHYQASIAYVTRALIRFARGDDAGALADAQQSVEAVQPISDPQLVHTALALVAVVFLSLGEEVRARETLDVVLDGLGQVGELAFAATEFHYVAWVALRFGREADIARVLAREKFALPWLRVAQVVVAGEFSEAADLLAAMESPTQEAFYRLRAAEQLVAEGRRAEADQELQAALAFYRSVGATRHVREGEALLAASA
jgi:tetratricopeptide (TPR) repeat protein